jgi:hypothetical protein
MSSTIFFRPLIIAAKELGIAVTYFKKICRNFGIHGWPCRKIASREKTIAILEKLRKGCQKDDENEKKLKAKIETLKNEVSSMFLRGSKNFVMSMVL